ncbi:MAG: TPM domain-containing protein [Melioribacteraceae bacterium]|nr:TPM domain-containing protein [Melioribacteraceae bacterium]
MKRSLLISNIIIILFLNSSINFAQINIPILKNYANDFTNTLNSSELFTLENKLKSFDDSTSNQVLFLMISTLDGYSLESYTFETATKNKIGSKKNNNGVLFFVAKEDRKMRIEVGYGLEGALPDALASSILRNEVRPYFKAGDYYGGITAGIDAIISATKGEYKAEKKSEKTKGISFFFLIILFIIISLISRRGGRGGGGGSGILPWLILSSMSSGRSSWGSSGGFGGFSGGGFSGGGGSFGGGGASGSW